MLKYAVGYYNKKDSDFVILATTNSSLVAECIVNSYNREYEKIGLSVRAISLLYNEVPLDHRYAVDNT